MALALPGPEYQNRPTLVPAEPSFAPASLLVSQTTGRPLLTGLLPVAAYLATAVSRPQPQPPDLTSGGGGQSSTLLALKTMGVLTASLHFGTTVLADGISVDLSIEGSDPADSRWAGSFKVGPSVPLSLDSICTLSFADGRTGDIQITRLAYGGRKDDVRVHFRGSGRLR